MVSGTGDKLRFGGSPLVIPAGLELGFAGSSTPSPGLTVSMSSVRVANTRIQRSTVTRSSSRPVFCAFIAAAIRDLYCSRQNNDVLYQREHVILTSLHPSLPFSAKGNSSRGLPYGPVSERLTACSLRTAQDRLLER
ncbi:hypothetical protein EYF80_044427 [Liparis tanakae]|uniref:Uncharacterized protein n=1 Tax=Liparis tanakae TaxID=230148 RepID=A0A4Z2FVX4_9TELE|nr:hypothetical protein EYF80_044427 [Liparis tanakae]